MFKLELQEKPEIHKCEICGRTLTDPESIRAGAGPVCRGDCRKSDYQEDGQMSIEFNKPEMIICMGNVGFDINGNQIVSGRDEIELAANILALHTEPTKEMAKAFVGVIQGATRGVVRARMVEKFIKEWSDKNE